MYDAIVVGARCAGSPTLRENQHETNRHFGTIAGTVPIPEFFSPQNIQRVMETAVKALGV